MLLSGSRQDLLYCQLADSGPCWPGQGLSGSTQPLRGAAVKLVLMIRHSCRSGQSHHALRQMHAELELLHLALMFLQSFALHSTAGDQRLYCSGYSW